MKQTALPSSAREDGLVSDKVTTFSTSTCPSCRWQFTSRPCCGDPRHDFATQCPKCRLRIQALRRFYVFLRDTCDLPVEDITAKLPRQKTTEAEVPVLSREQIKKIIDGCDKSLLGLRDAAMIHFLYDSGVRISECLALTVDDVGADGHVRIWGKGRRERPVRIGSRVRTRLMRYLTERGRRGVKDPHLWMGRKGMPLKRESAYRAIRAAGERVGIPGVFPHMLRHSFVHQWLLDGGSEGDVQRLAGWRSRAI